jgi:hypothetical protein
MRRNCAPHHQAMRSLPQGGEVQKTRAAGSVPITGTRTIPSDSLSEPRSRHGETTLSEDWRGSESDAPSSPGLARTPSYRPTLVSPEMCNHQGAAHYLRQQIRSG